MSVVDLVERAKAGLCPICDKGPFALLALHTNLAHDIDKRELRDVLGLTYTGPDGRLVSDEFSATRAENAARNPISSRTDPAMRRRPHDLSQVARARLQIQARRNAARIKARKEVEREAVRTSPGDPRHGNASSYWRYGCRCDRCKAAWARRVAETRDRLSSELTPDDPRHGRPSTYGYGCRCDACRLAQRTHDAQRKISRKAAS